jgi:SAM-dependent methyltransferase
MDYESRKKNEIDNYQNVTTVHDLPEIYHYWSSRYLQPKFESLGYNDLNDFYVQQINAAGKRGLDEVIRILSVGSGNCDTEVELAKLFLAQGQKNFQFSCLDLNAAMLDRGRQLASKSGLSENFDFICCDINSWEPDTAYDVVFANQCLHHFVELERLFDCFRSAMKKYGILLTNDMIGRNGHMRWPEAVIFMETLWSTLDRRYMYNHQKHQFDDTFVNQDCSQNSFEGIRSQDILPLLCERFHFDVFVGFCNLITPFIDRAYGHNYQPDNPLDCQYIEIVARMDDHLIDSGVLKPTQMVAAISKTELGTERCLRHRSSKNSIRWP